jgi:plastocyanin
MPGKQKALRCLLLWIVALISTNAWGRTGSDEPIIDVHVRVQLPKLRAHMHAPPVVVWLKPLGATPVKPFVADARYTLAQKNRTFVPHLLVVPVGAEVLFPNLDPFFHNVFSLFDGKRFDLGLYEAGTTKRVTFSREGVSYIFCNIHPEMSAVVLVLSTPLYSTNGENGVYAIRNVPAGDYEMHVWVEGLTQTALEHLKRRVQIAPGEGDLGVVDASAEPRQPAEHLNKFGQPYDRDTKQSY